MKANITGFAVTGLIIFLFIAVSWRVKILRKWIYGVVA